MGIMHDGPFRADSQSYYRYWLRIGIIATVFLTGLACSFCLANVPMLTDPLTEVLLAVALVPGLRFVLDSFPRTGSYGWAIDHSTPGVGSTFGTCRFLDRRAGARSTEGENIRQGAAQIT